jgi:hypothetical protein
MRTAFIVVFCIVGGIVAGMEIGWRQHAAEAERPIYLTKACPAPVAAPQSSRKECVESCFVKDRMARIKGVTG